MKRSTLLRRQKRITTALAPLLSPYSVTANPRPEQRCCGCCDSPCHSADRHTDSGCTVVGHEPRDGAA